MPPGRSSGLIKTTQILSSSSLRLELVGNAITDGENSFVFSARITVKQSMIKKYLAIVSELDKAI